MIRINRFIPTIGIRTFVKLPAKTNTQQTSSHTNSTLQSRDPWPYTVLYHICIFMVNTNTHTSCRYFAYHDSFVFFVFFYGFDVIDGIDRDYGRDATVSREYWSERRCRSGLCINGFYSEGLFWVRWSWRHERRFCEFYGAKMERNITPPAVYWMPHCPQQHEAQWVLCYLQGFKTMPLVVITVTYISPLQTSGKQPSSLVCKQCNGSTDVRWANEIQSISKSLNSAHPK